MDYNMSMSSNSTIKHDVFRIGATVAGVVLAVVPIMLWGIDAKNEALSAKIDAMDVKMSSRYESIQTDVKSIGTRMDDMYRYIDAKTDKTP
jgi:hypothetical protein